MNRHTTDMLHDPTTHEAVRRFELLGVAAIVIAVLYGVLNYLVF